MKKSPIHRRQPALRCGNCTLVSTRREDLQPICMACGSPDIESGELHSREYTLFHKLMSLLGGYGWPQDWYEFKRVLK